MFVLPKLVNSIDHHLLIFDYRLNVLKKLFSFRKTRFLAYIKLDFGIPKTTC